MENKENRNKYKAQIKYRKSNYKQFNIDFRIDTFNKFKQLCKSNNTTPTTEIKNFVTDYINKYSN